MRALPCFVLVLALAAGACAAPAAATPRISITGAGNGYLNVEASPGSVCGADTTPPRTAMLSDSRRTVDASGVLSWSFTQIAASADTEISYTVMCRLGTAEVTAISRPFTIFAASSRAPVAASADPTVSPSPSPSPTPSAAPSASPTPPVTPAATSTGALPSVSQRTPAPTAVPVPTEIAVAPNECVVGEVAIGGLNWLVRCTASATLYVDPVTPVGGIGVHSDALDRAVFKFQSDFGRTYAARPRAFLVSSDAIFGAAARGLYNVDLPANVEAVFVSCCGPNAPSMLLRNPTDPVYADAHEIAHWMIWQLSGNRLPLWFDEGLAEYEARTLAGSEAYRARNQCIAAEVAKNNTVPLDPRQIDLGSAWGYPVAHETVGLLMSDLGMSALVRILELARAGAQFEAAYLAVTGIPFTDFTATYRERLAKLPRIC